jgi:DNA-binding transcriptional LysR family regulator
MIGMKLTEIDLNLMLVMHVVLQERSVSRAAKRLRVTPPAVSNSLARLRELLGDPLFVRQGRGVVPTPFTLDLESELAGAIASMERVVTSKAPRDPAEIERSFILACSDVDRLCSVPGIVAILSARMPRATLHVVSIDRLLAAGGLETGAADVTIAPQAPLSPGLHGAALYRDRAVVLVRKDHPDVGARLTARVFNTLSHVDIRMALGDPGIGHAMAERAFAAAGLRRRVAVTVPDFLAAAMVASRTDYAAGVPKRLADEFAEPLGLRVLQFPGARLEFPMQMVWHDRTNADEPAARFRRVMRDAFA